MLGTAIQIYLMWSTSDRYIYNGIDRNYHVSKDERDGWGSNCSSLTAFQVDFHHVIRLVNSLQEFLKDLEL